MLRHYPAHYRPRNVIISKEIGRMICSRLHPSLPPAVSGTDPCMQGLNHKPLTAATQGSRPSRPFWASSTHAVSGIWHAGCSWVVALPGHAHACPPQQDKWRAINPLIFVQQTNLLCICMTTQTDHRTPQKPHQGVPMGRSVLKLSIPY